VGRVKCRPAFGSTAQKTLPCRIVCTRCPVLPSGQGQQNRRPDVGVQRDRLLVQADDGFGRSVGLFISRPERLPSLDVLPIQFRHATTFFSRHGFRSWLSNKIRTVSRHLGHQFALDGLFGDQTNGPTGIAIRGWLQTMAMIRCFWGPSKSCSAPRPGRS